jgi:hypothetical protein
METGQRDPLASAAAPPLCHSSSSCSCCPGGQGCGTAASEHWLVVLAVLVLLLVLFNPSLLVLVLFQYNCTKAPSSNNKDFATTKENQWTTTRVKKSPIE